MLQVHGRKDLISMGHGNYSVETTANVFSQFNSYFNTSYPIEKLDSVAVPLKGGAMENYGLIIYREDLLMYSPEMNTEQERYDITVS
jgi:aminopeptidase N